MPLTPKNRKEEWLEGLVDHETTLTPKNRCESWMKEIIDASGGGGGTGGGALVVTDSDSGERFTLSESWKTIWDSYKTGTMVIILTVDEENIDAMQWLVQEVYYDDGLYCVDANGITFRTDNENGYPISNME